MTQPHERRIAAVDLGSNSFRLELGVYDNGRFERTEYLKETVRLGGGIDHNGHLTMDAMQRGWDCLARFGQRLVGFDGSNVLAVATQTLREACNRDDFLGHGAKILGFPIHVISGTEEARLIYQGVAQALPHSLERRLVIDIGGRSTELILGQGAVPEVMDSCHVGSISWSMQFFADQRFVQTSFDAAEAAARAVLAQVQSAYRSPAWNTAYGSAGTVSAVSDVLAEAGWPAGAVDRTGLDWLKAQLLKAQSTHSLHLAGMREDRKAIIGGGLSILCALFDVLDIRQLVLATGGLRHGLLLDISGRFEGGHRLP